MSTMRKKARENEDLPLPVLPQIPTWKRKEFEFISISRRQTNRPVHYRRPVRYFLGASRLCHLLPWADVCVDIFEHGLQRGVVADAQVLDLDLSLPGPAVGDLRHS